MPATCKPCSALKLRRPPWSRALAGWIVAASNLRNRHCSALAPIRSSPSRMQQAAHGVQWAAQAMDEQRKGLAAARRSLLWIGAMALLIGSLLAAGGTAWIAHRSMQEIAQA